MLLKGPGKVSLGGDMGSAVLVGSGDQEDQRRNIECYGAPSKACSTRAPMKSASPPATPSKSHAVRFLSDGSISGKNCAALLLQESSRIDVPRPSGSTLVSGVRIGIDIRTVRGHFVVDYIEVNQIADLFVQFCRRD